MSMYKPSKLVNSIPLFIVIRIHCHLMVTSGDKWSLSTLLLVLHECSFASLTKTTVHVTDVTISATFDYGDSILSIMIVVLALS